MLYDSLPKIYKISLVSFVLLLFMTQFSYQKVHQSLCWNCSSTHTVSLRSRSLFRKGKLQLVIQHIQKEAELAQAPIIIGILLLKTKQNPNWTNRTKWLVLARLRLFKWTDDFEVNELSGLKLKLICVLVAHTLVIYASSAHLALCREQKMKNHPQYCKEITAVHYCVV